MTNYISTEIFLGTNFRQQVTPKKVKPMKICTEWIGGSSYGGVTLTHENLFLHNLTLEILWPRKFLLLRYSLLLLCKLMYIGVATAPLAMPRPLPMPMIRSAHAVPNLHWSCISWQNMITNHCTTSISRCTLIRIDANSPQVGDSMHTNVKQWLCEGDIMCSAAASKLRRGVTFFRKWTMIRVHACDACSMSKFHCKTLMNRHRILSTFIQTISNTLNFGCL